MKTIFSFLIVCVLSVCLHSQEIGKIYNKADAAIIYGPVSISAPISTAELKQIMSKTSKVTLFRLVEGKLLVADNKRSVLYSDGQYVQSSSNDVFRAFSNSVITKLLESGNSGTTYVEIRNNDVLTVTNGEYTMEASFPCPPYCTD